MARKTQCPLCAGMGYQMICHSNPNLIAQEPLMKQFCTTCNGTGSIESQETNGDRIRSMDDKKLAHFIHELVSSDYFCRFCPNIVTCMTILDGEGGEIEDIWCEETIVKWLHTPHDEIPSGSLVEKTPNWCDDEKQESGLIEED